MHPAYVSNPISPPNTPSPFRFKGVENLAQALASEQDQRLKKEKMLQELLMEETLARIQAEEVFLSVC